ncbi:MAG TPA: M36 family metallopeptidase [Polyangia bacterium]
MRRVIVPSVCISGLALVLSCAPGQPVPAPPAAPTPSGALAAAGPRVFAGSVATAGDRHRTAPRFLWATTRQAPPAGATAEQAARAHLAAHAPAYGLDHAALAGAELAAVHDDHRGGLIVTLRQQAHGLEVYRGEVKVLMRRDLTLVALSGTPVALPAAAPAFPRSAAEALAAALGAQYAVALPAGAVVPAGTAPGGYTRVDLAAPVPVANGRLRLGEPARVKPVLFAERGQPRAAYFVELFAGTGARAFANAYRYLVAADDLAILERRNLTKDAQYRVWADASGRPLDGPQADFTPHPTGTPDGSDPAFIAPVLVAQDGFNHTPAGTADPWLAPGATETRGNNVDAYADLQAPDGFSSGDLRATTTADGVFDRVYDVTLAPDASNDQIMAGLTQLFYTTNWLHDWYYDSGFDEAAGNAQQNNFGRGGRGGDPLVVQGNDYSGTNNSDMSVVSDGASPRMQAYIWSGAEQRSLQVTTLGVTMATGAAGFGPTTFDLTGDLTLVDDGTGTTTDACEAIANDVAGTIALLDRGTCTFKQKAVAAAAAGAIGVILANNTGGGPIAMPDGTPQGAVAIPVLSVSQADGATLKAALAQGPVTAHLTRAAGVDRDGALDNTVVAHEWGHYLHLRLVDCNQGMCGAMSEGWGDFVALHLALRDGDDLDGTYAMSTYAAKSMGDSGYFGIRRAPYSVDFTKNAFTFRHIADTEDLPTTTPLNGGGAPNSEVHNAGEIWAEMLFEAYVALLKTAQGPTPTRTFDEVRRTMSDYVVAGLKLTPPDATYTEGRDAILAAAAARSADDVALLAAAFARRGAGSCAESPARDSWDFAGVVESYDVKPQIVAGTPTLDDGLQSCDSSGTLDAGERGTLRIDVVNASVIPAAGATVTVTSPTAGITFPAGATVDVGPLAPFATATASVEVALDRGATAMQPLAFAVAVTTADACKPTVNLAAGFRANVEEREAATATDDVEAKATAWVFDGQEADNVWSRVEATAGNHVWRGIDLARPSDSWLTSPALPVSATAPFVMSFRHKHEFERADQSGAVVYYDGAVIEVSTDNGATWEDISTYGDPGYGGTIDNTSGNPLADRSGYVDHNPAWPKMDDVSIDLGTALAGQSVRVRFHIGTDQAAGGAGWEIDDIAFAGVDNTPFTLLAERPSACPPAAAEDGGAPGADGGAPVAGTGGGGCGCVVGASAEGGTLLLGLLAAVLARRRLSAARRCVIRPGSPPGPGARPGRRASAARTASAASR